MSKPLRLALVGCGRQMRKNLFPFLQRIRGHEIVACVDSDLALAEELRSLAGAAVCADSVEAVDLEHVDAAVLAVPPGPSHPLTTYLVERDVDCFVEKPAGPSTPALEELDRKIQRHDRYVQVGFNFRYAETLQQLHEFTEIIRATPCEVSIDFYSRHPSAPQWGVDTTLESWVRHNGAHVFDLARWFIPSPVVRVDAHAIQSGVDRFHMTVALRHRDGSLSLLRMGNHVQRFLVAVSIQGMDGSRYTAPSLEQVTLELDAGKPFGGVLHSVRNLDHGWARSGFGPELATFLDACRMPSKRAPAWPSVADALAASMLCDQALDQLSTTVNSVFKPMAHPLQTSAKAL